MTDAELIHALRTNALWVTTHDAADRIEALTKERDDAVVKRAAWELEAKIAQVKLAKVVEALDGLLMHKPDYLLAKNARATLAELKGESHE